MKILGMEVIESSALEQGQMLVVSGDMIYGWDLSKDGDCCVTVRRNKDGTFTVIDSTMNSGTDGDVDRT